MQQKSVSAPCCVSDGNLRRSCLCGKTWSGRITGHQSRTCSGTARTAAVCVVDAKGRSVRCHSTLPIRMGLCKEAPEPPTMVPGSRKEAPANPIPVTPRSSCKEAPEPPTMILGSREEVVNPIPTVRARLLHRAVCHAWDPDLHTDGVDPTA